MSRRSSRHQFFVGGDVIDVGSFWRISSDKRTNVVTVMLRYGFIVLAVDLLALTIAFAVGIDLVFAPDRLLNNRHWSLHDRENEKAKQLAFSPI